MSTAQTLLEYINAVKWPVVAVGLALYFRRTIDRLMGRVHRFTAEAGPARLELEAARTVDLIESEADAEPRESIVPGHHRGRRPLPAEPVSEYSVDAADQLERSAFVPGLETAALLGPEELPIVYLRLKDLHDFAEGPSGDPMDLMMRTVTDPSRMLIETARELSRIVKSLRPPGAQWVLWPDRPEPLYRGFRELRRLYSRAISHPADVTPSVVYDFDRAARLWAARYAGFIDAALRAVGGSVVENSAPTAIPHPVRDTDTA